MSFVHLHVHSHYSFLRGADGVDALAQHAARQGMPALALTDINGLYGAVPFQQACETHAIRPIFGAQLVTPSHTCLALIKNTDGYQSLCRIITALQLCDDEFDLAAHLAGDREGLVVISRDAKLLAHLIQLSGPNDLYVEMTPTTKTPAWECHRQTDLPLLATNAVWFAEPGGFARHRLLAAIGSNSSLGRIPADRVAPCDSWLAPSPVMKHAFREIPDAPANAVRVADMCRLQLPLGQLRLPRFPFTSGSDAFAVLRAKTEAGLARRYGTVSETVRRQVGHELAIIRDLDYADYFLIVADIVAAAQEMGIPTCGRGSAANSVVAYVLELTHVEPLSHNLYFERFLNRGRSDCPDVDIDFSWRDRDRVIDWVYDRYGRDRVAMISTHVCFATRGAVREIAKVMGIPGETITRITRRLPSGWGTGPIAEQIGRDPRAHGLPIDEEPWRTVFDWATQIHGFPKHLGVHAGGIVIAPTALTDHLPLQRAAKETDAGRVVVTQWDMYPVEDAGLVKIDLLGNRSLAVIDDAIRAVRAGTGVDIDYTQFDPQQDNATRQMIRQGNTMGCFYVESPSMRGLLRKLDCDTFDGLVAASSIIRPGISSSGMMQAYIDRFHYVRRHGAQDPTWYLHPCMREALEETFGVMAYQEDVLKVAEGVALMNPEDADGLRKSMSKKRDFIAIEGYHRQFVEGASRNGCHPAIAEELWRQIESFSGYSFCKAHSASYALISYQAAYLRAHHPAAFMAAVLSNYGGYYSTFAYISEARRLGLTVLGPCINTSERHFTAGTDTIRIGLSQIRHVTRRHIDRLLDERRRGPFRDIADFIHRASLSPAEIDMLIRAGALDSVTGRLNRPQLMRLNVLLQARTPADERAQSSLFAPQVPPIPPIPDYSPPHLATLETEALGFPVTAHPLDLYQSEFKKRRLMRACDMHKHIGRKITLAGWQITRKRLRTRTDEPMLFISFEDKTALYEAVMFPRAYTLFAPLTMHEGPFIVTGTVTEDHGTVTLTVSDLKLVADTVAHRRTLPPITGRTDGRPVPDRWPHAA